MSRKKIVKLSSPWDHIDFTSRISHNNPSPEYEFVFDGQDGVTVCDYWIIWGGIKQEKEKAVCSPQNVIYLTDEVHEQRFFNKRFLEQFAAIVTCRTDIRHDRVIPTHELNTWMVDRDFDWLYSHKDIPKSRTLSVVSSDQTWLPGHKLRYAFVNKLIGHFKDKIDVFGRGFSPVDDKFDALADYKYSIAIENSVIPGYFTEKITDCYLTHTMPIYFGCPDIEEYFDPGSLSLVDPNDFESAVEKIEQVIEEDRYADILPLLLEQKNKYLDEYHIFNKIVKILDREFPPSEKKTSVCIRNEHLFQRGFATNKFIASAFRKLHLPGRMFFQVSFDQSRTYANK
jgi:hypothetical protein